MAPALAAHANFPAPPNAEGQSESRPALAWWPLVVAVTTGSIASVSTDVFALSRELFLLPYVLSACVLGLVFAGRQHVDVAAAVTRNPMLTAGVTLVAAALMITTVMLQPGAPTAHGVRLAFEIAWDGVAYGAVDGLLLTVIPMAAVARARATGGRMTNFLAFVASVFVFIVYHLGFAEFRSSALVAPVVASVVFGSTYLACRNPLAPITAHAAMHVAAVLHGPCRYGPAAAALLIPESGSDPPKPC